MRDSYVVGEFGDSDSWQGVFRMEPFREASFFEFWRGNYATGIRGIIDPLIQITRMVPSLLQIWAILDQPKEISL